MVMTHKSNPGHEPIAEDEVEWMLDGGSQWTVVNDPTLFARLAETSQLLFGNGSTETAAIHESVLMHVVNMHTN
jgi:hypothetical protein